MSVAVLKLEDETLVAFNLNNVTKMRLDKDGLWFAHDDVCFATWDNDIDIHLKLHPSVCGKDGVMLHSAEAMFEKFCNL